MSKTQHEAGALVGGGESKKNKKLLGLLWVSAIWGKTVMMILNWSYNRNQDDRNHFRGRCGKLSAKFLEVKRQNLKGYQWCHWEEKLGCVSIYHGRNGVHDKMQYEMIL